MIATVAATAWTTLIAACEAAWPREACGWVSGDGDVATDVHPARPGGTETFAFADDDLIALIAAYRYGPAPRLLYHSHPRGPAAMSAADRAALAPGGAVLHPLPHLIVAVRAGRAEDATLYQWRDGAPVIAAGVVRNPDGTWHPREAAA